MSNNEKMKCHYCGVRTSHQFVCGPCKGEGHGNVQHGLPGHCSKCVELWNNKQEIRETLTGENGVRLNYENRTMKGRPRNG